MPEPCATKFIEVDSSYWLCAAPSTPVLTPSISVGERSNQNPRNTWLKMNFSDYANLPIEPPPPGIVPNFDHPHRRVIILYAGVGVCLGITLVFVLLRIYSKLAVTHTWGWDDGEFLSAVTFLETYGTRGLPYGICETMGPLTHLNCSDRRWRRDLSQPTMVSIGGVSFIFR